jgi:hypothetical protein
MNPPSIECLIMQVSFYVGLSRSADELFADVVQVRSDRDVY